MKHLGLVINTYGNHATLRMTPHWVPFMLEVARVAWGATDGATLELERHPAESHDWRDLDADQLRSLEYAANHIIYDLRQKDVARTRQMVPTDPPIEIHDNPFYSYIAREVRSAAQEIEFHDISVECPECLHRFQPNGWEKR